MWLDYRDNRAILEEAAAFPLCMENSFRKPVVRLMLNVDVVVDADVKLKYNCCLLMVNNDKKFK